MSEENEALNSFMMNKNKEALGEKVETQIDNDDNFLDDRQKVKNTFNGEGSSNSSDKGLLMARRAMNAMLTIPILIGGIVSVFYMLLKLGPFVLAFFRRIAIGLFV